MLHLDAALTLLDRADDAAAADVLGTLAVETPVHATVHVLLAQACERLHRWDEALSAWQTARLLLPDLALVQQGTLRAAQVLAALQTLRAPEPLVAGGLEDVAFEASGDDVSTEFDAGLYDDGVDTAPGGDDEPSVDPYAALRHPGAGRFASTSPVFSQSDDTGAAPPTSAADPYAPAHPAQPRAAAARVADPYRADPYASPIVDPYAPPGAVPVEAPPVQAAFVDAPPQARPVSRRPEGPPPSVFFDPLADAIRARPLDDARAGAPRAPEPPAILEPAARVVPEAPGAVRASEEAPSAEASPAWSHPMTPEPESLWDAPRPVFAPAPVPATASDPDEEAVAGASTMPADPAPPVASLPVLGPPPSALPSSPPPPVPSFAPPEIAPPPRLPDVPPSFDLDDLIESLSTAGRIVPHADPNASAPPEGLDADDADEVVSPTLARIFAAQGQYADAIRAYERLAAADPARAADFLAEADALRNRGR